MTMAAAAAAITAALQRFSVFLIPYHASDCQNNGRGYDCKNDNCTHIYQPFRLNNSAYIG